MANDVELIGIDTNILARYIVQDDQVQSKQASNFLENLTTDRQGYISTIVLIELIWLLRRVYHQSRMQVAYILEELLATESLRFEHYDQVLQVLITYKSTASDFSDLLISLLNRQQGCRYTITFDTGAVNKAGMVKLDRLT